MTTAQEPAVLPGSATDALENAVIMVYGDTGTGKSTLLATYIEYVWETFKKITRVYTLDPGGFPSKVQVLMRLGIAQVWRMRNHVEPFETFEYASLGYWPAEMDYRTGLAHPQVPLVAPAATEYTILCPQGHEALKTTNRSGITASLQCPTCKLIVTPQNWRLSTRTIITPGMDKIGGRAYDSLTAFNDEVMDDMARRSAQGELGGAGSALGKGDAGKIVSGSMVFGGNNQAHYGQAQTRSRRWLSNSTTIVGLVAPPFWTALEERATDQNTNLTIFGPSIAGRAKTADVPSWVGNCLRTTTRKNQQNQDEWRLYLRQHAFQEEGNIPHLCKHRTDPDRMPEYLADPPDASAHPEKRYSVFSIKHFFTLLAAAQEQAAIEAANRYVDAPALTGDVPTSVEIRPEAEANFRLSQVAMTGPAVAPQPTTGTTTTAAAPVASANVNAQPGSTAPPISAVEMFRRQQQAAASATTVSPAASAAPATPAASALATLTTAAPEAPTPPASTASPSVAAPVPTQQTLPEPKAPAPPRPPVARGPVQK